MSDNLPQTARPPSGFRTPVSLIARIHSRDPFAWEHFYAVYSPLIRHICHRWGVRGEDGEDVAQEVFQAVLTSIHTYRRDQLGQVRTFRSWLGGVVRNKIRSHYQAAAAHPAAEGGSDALRRLHECTGEEEQVDESVYQQVCLQALGRIREEFAPQHWQAFWRTSVDGQSASAVAAELGMSSVAVRQAKSRVLRRLREELGEAPD